MPKRFDDVTGRGDGVRRGVAAYRPLDAVVWAVARVTNWCGAWLATADWSKAVRPLLIAQVLGFAFMVAGTHGAFGPQPVPPTTTDFASFYAAGFLANRGSPEAAYDQAAHRAAEFRTVDAGVDEKRFLNPPVFLLVCAVLARLPYLIAFVSFELATCLAWLVLATRIAGGAPLAAMALAAVPSVWWALGWGQNSFLSASLMAAGTLLVRRRPLLAGAAFGALCFKPHLALLVPVALIAGRHWRALVAALASVGSLCALSTACFGWVTWKAYVAAAVTTRPSVEIGTGLAAHIDLVSAARLLGSPPALGWFVQILATGVSALCVARLWRLAGGLDARPRLQALANAGLIAGTIVAAPFLLFYDVVVVSLAAAWIAGSARQHGWQRGDQAVLAVLVGLDLVAFPSAALLHLAVGAAIPLALLCLSLRGVLWSSGDAVDHGLVDGHSDDTAISDRNVDRHALTVHGRLAADTRSFAACLSPSE